MKRPLLISASIVLVTWGGRAHAGLRDWLPWRKTEPEPVAEPITVLGMEPLTAVLALIGILAAALTLYYRPRAFMRGFAETMGSMAGAVIGIIAGGAVLVGAAAVYFEAAGISVVVILAIIGVLALMGFLSGGT